MISSYRLGDLVLLTLTKQEQDEILEEHPDSIGAKYILEKRNNNSIGRKYNLKKRNNYLSNNNINININIDIITKIVLENIEQKLHLLPNDITESTVIHLRLGDVIAGNEQHEKSKRPLDVNYIKSLVANDINKKYIIGKCFFAKPSSTNYEECIYLSNKYLHDVIDKLEAEHFNSGNPDIDLYCAIKSKIFIQGKGFFSKLIVEIRKKLNLICIETKTHNAL